MRNTLWAISGVAALFLAGASARATVIASDSFVTGVPGGYSSGTVGDKIGGQAATTGTVGYFTGAPGGNPAPGWNPGTFSDVIVAGGPISAAAVNQPPVSIDGSINARGDGVARLQYRDFASATPPASPDYYFSALLYQTAFGAYQGASYIGLGPSRASALAPSTPPTTGLAVGYNNGALSLFYNNGGAALATEPLLASTGIASYLVKVAITGSGAATTLTPTVYDFRANVLNNPAAQAVTAILAPSDMGAFQLFQTADFNNTSPANISFDELRFATTESEVAVPEPGSLGLIGIGLALLTRRTARRACRI